MAAKKSGWGAISSLFVRSDEPVAVEPVASDELEPAVDPLAALPPRRSVSRPSPVPPMSSAAAAALGVPASAASATEGSSDIVEGRAFEEIYATYEVPASPYPVEKLLAVVAGLSAMPEAQIQMCVTAMDAADESWSIEDPVADARIKIEVLGAEKQRLAEQAAALESDGKIDIAAADTGLAETAAQIKNEIDQLQARLHETMAATATRKAEIEGRVRSAQQAVLRESFRLDSEISRLNRIPNTFGTGPKPPVVAGR